jgi:hypothetical protein
MDPKEVPMRARGLLVLAILVQGAHAHSAPAQSGASDQPVQYLTWDAGSGPNNAQWSRKLRLSWVHSGVGDWLDATGTPQGSTAFASGSVSANGPVSFNVTSLVSKAVSSGKNRGFYLRSSGTRTLTFAGRTHADASMRPKLTITTGGGTITRTARCNANWSPSSAYGTDSRASFKVLPSGWLAIVQFDLTGLTGTVTAATLTLTSINFLAVGQVQIFEANPPTFLVGGGGRAAVQGIAQSYDADRGIETHPSVVFAGDFSVLARPNWGGSVVSPEKFTDPVTGRVYLRGKIPEGGLGGCSLEHDVVRGTQAGVPDKTETELYARYYVKLDSDWGSTVDGNKMPGWDARLGWWNSSGYWYPVTGNGGSPGTGLKVWNSTAGRWEYHGHSLRGHGGTSAGDGNPYDQLFWLGGYIYHLDQVGPYGEGVNWKGTVIDKGNWHCIEQHVKMNSITGPYDVNGNGTAVADGVYRAWVDGVLVYQRTNFRWRRHAEMGLQGFWLNWYHGGTSPTLHDMHFNMGSVVIAREYIGPLGTGAVPAPSAPPIPPAPAPSAPIEPAPAGSGDSGGGGGCGATGLELILALALAGLLRRRVRGR